MLYLFKIIMFSIKKYFSFYDYLVQNFKLLLNGIEVMRSLEEYALIYLMNFLKKYNNLNDYNFLAYLYFVVIKLIGLE